MVRKSGCKKILLFSRKLERLDAGVRDVLHSLREQTAYVVDDIRPEPDLTELNKIIEHISGRSFDLVVAVGGGSVIDSAKAVMAGYANHADMKDLFQHASEFKNRLPLIAIPTTSGTGSEVTRAAALTCQGVKQPVFSDILYPSTAIIDPELTRSCPPMLTASCGFDVLAHAVESLMHRNANPISESLAKDAVRLCVKFFRQVYDCPYDAEARTAMSEASVKAGMAIASSGCSAAHAFSYRLSSDYGIPHGEACAFLLDGLVSLCTEYDGRMDSIAMEIGFDNGIAFSKWILELKRHMHIRNSMGEFGVAQGEEADLVSACVDSLILKNHYFPITEEMIWKITGRF